MDINFYNSCLIPQWAHIEYTWKIERFWELRALASIEALDDTTGSAVISSPFGDLKRGLWSLKLYPYGDTTAVGKGHVSIFLTLNPQNEREFYAIFSCSVLDLDETKAKHGPSYARQKFSPSNASWGWSNFITVQKPNSLSCVVNDCLLIRCTIDVFMGTTTVEKKDDNVSCFSTALRSYFRSPESCDLKLICGSTVFQTQKSLVSSRSTVLKKLLHENTDQSLCFGKTTDNDGLQDIHTKTCNESKECPEPNHVVNRDAKGNIESIIILHPQVTSQSIKLMLQYMLYDTCDAFDASLKELNEILDLFLTSFIYNVLPLFKTCVNTLYGFIDGKENALKILHIANIVKNEVLSNQCNDYINNAVKEKMTTIKLNEMISICSMGQADVNQKN